MRSVLSLPDLMLARIALSLLSLGLPGNQDVAGAALVLHARSRARNESPGPRAEQHLLRWSPSATAIVVCDMWDQHWCRGAKSRVAEMAPRMNAVLMGARASGVTIVHAPSETMAFYQGSPQRRRTLEVDRVEPVTGLEKWRGRDETAEPPLPIDDSDGGCDCEPRCESGAPWTRQTPLLTIAEEDFVSDRGEEVLNVFIARGIHHVIVMGVHVNMCVLGCPFAIRQLLAAGIDVSLMRDLTDSMYCSRKPPFVSHFRGTDLVVEHIERHLCPTVTSGDLLDGKEFRFAQDRRPRIAFVSSEDEYQSQRTLPEFAEHDLEARLGVRCLHVQSSSKISIPGLEVLNDADLLVMYVRRRTLPEGELARIRRYLESGKPLVALRTSSHAFENWPLFDSEVLGGHYHGHHSNKPPEDPATRVRLAPGAADHPIVHGFPVEEFTVASWLYKTTPLEPGTTPLLIGKVGEREPEEPVAWTFAARGARTFYTSLGHPQDFEMPEFRWLLARAILWALDQPLSEPVSVAARLLPCTPENAVRVEVPGCWERDLRFRVLDGFAWYRCSLRLPSTFSGAGVVLELGAIDNCDETFLNGEQIGKTGRFPPEFENGVEIERRYVVPARCLKPGEPNVIEVRVFDQGGAGGFKGGTPRLVRGEFALALEGLWQFHPGDQRPW